MQGVPTKTHWANGHLHGTLCDITLHYDAQGRPWFNDGGFQRNKRDSLSEHVEFSHMAYVGEAAYLPGSTNLTGKLTPAPDWARHVYNAYRALYNPNI